MKKRIHVVHYLRGMTSLVVAWYHLTNTYHDGMQSSGSYGLLGVEVFFVLSGFVIPWSIETTYEAYHVKEFANFISRRLVRIEVPYIVSIVLTLVLWHLSAVSPGFKGVPPHYTFMQIVSNIFYIVPFTGEAWFEPVYWTLAYEFAFYITIGLSFGVVLRGQQLFRYHLASAILVLAVVAGFLSNYLLLFLMGMIVFQRIRGRLGALATFVSLVICSSAIVITGGDLIALIGLATAAAIIFGQNFELNGVLGRSLTYLGTISYSLYLVHVPIGGRVVNLASRFAHGPVLHFFSSIVALVVSLISAQIFHSYVEQPALRRAQKLKLSAIESSRD